jgi:hypothetical protein
MVRYIWDSKNDIQTTLDNFLPLTYKGREAYTWAFKYTRLDNERYKFSLWPNGISRISYSPAYIKGSITVTPHGCIIEARRQRWSTVLSEIPFYAVTALEYSLAIGALVVGLDGAFIVCGMGGALATGSLLWHIHTQKKWGSGDNPLYLIDRAAGTAHRQRSY